MHHAPRPLFRAPSPPASLTEKRTRHILSRSLRGRGSRRGTATRSSQKAPRFRGTAPDFPLARFDRPETLLNSAGPGETQRCFADSFPLYAKPHFELSRGPF